MKNLLVLLFCCVCGLSAYAQCSIGKPSLSLILSDSSCTGDTNKIVVVATGSQRPYEYQINNGGYLVGNDSIFDNLSPNSYEIKVRPVGTGGDSCEASIKDTIRYQPIDVTQIEATNACAGVGGIGGQVFLFVSEGVGPYEYSEDSVNFDGILHRPGLAPGMHDFQIRGADGCVSHVSREIRLDSIVVDLVTTNKQCNSSQGGKIDVIFGGSATYMVSIDDGTVSPAPGGFYQETDIAPGSYTFKTSLGNCNNFTPFTIGDNNITSTVLDLSHATCDDEDGSFRLKVSDNAVDTVKYSIDGGITLFTDSVFQNLDDGTYPTKIVDSRGCEVLGTVVINNNGGVEAEISNDTIICAGDAANLRVNAVGDNLTYTWTNGLSDAASHDVTPTSLTMYAVTVADPFGCDVELEVNVDVNTYPTLSLSNNQIDFCKGDSVEIAMSGAERYLWSTGDTTSSYYVKYPFGASTLTVSGFNGVCETSQTIPVNIHEINATITDSQRICVGSSIDIAVNSVTQVTYDWDNNLANLSSHTLFPTTSTDYTVVIEDGFGCSDTLTTSVIVDQMPDLMISPSSVDTCVGENLVITASGADTYSWSTGEKTVSIAFAPPTNETISVVGKNGLCSQTKSIPIKVSQLPTVEIVIDSNRADTTGFIDFSVGNSMAESYIWSFGDGEYSTFDAPFHQYTEAGIYTVHLTGKIGECKARTAALVYIGVVGISENFENSLAIFPNPVNDKLSIQNSNNKVLYISLFDSFGKQVLDNTTSADSYSIDFSHLTPDVYFLRINSNTQSITKKIVKVH